MLMLMLTSGLKPLPLLTFSKLVAEWKSYSLTPTPLPQGPHPHPNLLTAQEK